MIKHPELKEYANLLHANGFTIRPGGRGYDYFTYSRVVDGVELFGTVSAGQFGGFSHSMPIKPSQANGSSMWVDGIADTTADYYSGSGKGIDPLTVAAAERITRPANHNPIVGTQRNARPWGANAAIYTPEAV